MQFIISHYNRCWTGIIIDSQKRHGLSDLLLILMVNDRNGKPFTKRMLRVLDVRWTNKTSPVNIEHIKPEWMQINNLPITIYNKFYK